MKLNGRIFCHILSINRVSLVYQKFKQNRRGRWIRTRETGNRIYMINRDDISIGAYVLRHVVILVALVSAIALIINGSISGGVVFLAMVLLEALSGFVFLEGGNVSGYSCMIKLNRSVQYLLPPALVSKPFPNRDDV